jgi:hypothetical protein
LRRATVLGLLFSVPVLFLHKQIETIDEWIHMPDWAWVLVASGLVYLLARAHEFVTELTDRLFDRRFILAERRLEAVRETIEHTDSLAEIERLLVEEPMASLKLASAALFREVDGVFKRLASVGWDAGGAETLSGEDPLLAARFQRKPHALHAANAGQASQARLPDDLARPVLAVPVGNARRRYALLLYGGHEDGTDLDSAKRDLLGSLAHDAQIAYAQIEGETLRKRVDALEGQLARASEHG